MATDNTVTAISTFLKKKNTNEDVSYSLKKTGAVPQIESDYELPHELQRCKQAGGQKHRAGNDMKPGKVLQPRSSDAFPPDKKSEMYKSEFPELPQPLYSGAVGETKKEPATFTTTERKAQATPATDPKYKTGTEPPDTISIGFGKTYMHETDEVSITNSRMGRLTNTLPLDAKAAVVKTTLPSHIKKPPEPSTSNGPASYPDSCMTRMPVEPRTARPAISLSDWSNIKKFWFIQDVSGFTSGPVRGLETDGNKIVNTNWIHHIKGKSKIFEAMQKEYVQYDGTSVKDLLRFIRNVSCHYHELPEDVKTDIGRPRADALNYFTTEFPLLLDHTYKVMEQFANHVDFASYYQINNIEDVFL